MRIAIALLLLSAVNGFAAFGNFPLTNGLGQVADFQCLYSGIVERCRAGDQAGPVLSFGVNVNTGMYVSSVTTGAIYTLIATNVPPTTNVTYYYTTNWAFGDASCVLSNWSGTNLYIGSNYVDVSYAWHGPMTVEELDAWDTALFAALPVYVDVEAMSSDWFTTPIGAVTNKRVIYADPCADPDPLVAITNAFVENVYRTSVPMLTRSNLFKRLGVGTDFYYAFDETSPNEFYTNGNSFAYNRNHDWRLTMIPTQSVVMPLATWRVVVTSTFYKTNVVGSGSNAVTNVVENYNLTLGKPTNAPAWLWFYDNTRLPTIYPKVPVECVDYRYRTNAAVYLSVICPNTNTPAPDLSDAKLQIIGATTYWTLSNAVGYAIGLATCKVSGITDGQALDTPIHEVMAFDFVNYWDTVYDCFSACDPYSEDWYDCWVACDMALVALSTSDWSRVETNGQWDTMIGTTVSVMWSNTVAFYGYDQVATWNGVGATYALWPVYAESLNERYTVITSLVATTKTSPAGELGPELAWLATYREYGSTHASCMDRADSKSLSEYDYAAQTATNTINRTFAQGPGTGINSFYGGARRIGSATAFNVEFYTSPLDPIYLINYAGITVGYADNLSGTPYIRMASLAPNSNSAPPNILTVETYAVPSAKSMYPAYLDEVEPATHLQYTLVSTVGPLVGHVKAIIADYFAATNWVFVADSGTKDIPSYGLLTPAWWDWQRTADAGVCSSDHLDHPEYGIDFDPPQCVINAAHGDPISGGIMEDTFSASEAMYYNLLGIVTWDFEYK